MERNKILEAAQQNHNIGCEYENNESIKSSLLGLLVSMLVGTVLFLIEYYANGYVNFSLIVVGMTVVFVQCLYEGIKTKKRQLIIVSILSAVITFFALIAFAVQVVSQ